MWDFMKTTFAVRLAAACMAMLACLAVAPQSARAADTYGAQEIVDAGHRFFGSTTGGLATLVERIFSQYGLPNGYVLGEEGSGAIAMQRPLCPWPQKAVYRGFGSTDAEGSFRCEAPASAPGER